MGGRGEGMNPESVEVHRRNGILQEKELGQSAADAKHCHFLVPELAALQPSQHLRRPPVFSRSTRPRSKRASADGIAEVSKGEIVGQNAVLTLTGIIPYERGGLALIGMLEETETVVDTSQIRQPDNSIQFFVGGSWPAPVISPIAGN